MKKAGIIMIICVIVLASFLIFKMTGNTISSGTRVRLETNHGDIVIELYGDMPITTGNFKNLVEQGKYDGVIFHRIIDGFMIQGGDPTGTGFGDPSIPNIQDEFTHAGGNKNDRYTISMANAGPNTGSSQFFINMLYVKISLPAIANFLSKYLNIGKNSHTTIPKGPNFDKVSFCKS